ncbi:hypothetical protein B0F88_1019 [Methylobacter tundripaludum]|uniref:Uncharacterized protein n=1 Tax=Methylobacter tundripaludum TaxID=173365 RepID=A0A2S6H7U5_9GAMM|nr:hypothetical protein B0F88_1019 [Methylobacter tundripaludum]
MVSRGEIEDSQLHALKNSGTGSGVTRSKASFKKNGYWRFNRQDSAGSRTTLFPTDREGHW